MKTCANHITEASQHTSIMSSLLRHKKITFIAFPCWCRTLSHVNRIKCHQANKLMIRPITYIFYFSLACLRVPFGSPFFSHTISIVIKPWKAFSFLRLSAFNLTYCVGMNFSYVELKMEFGGSWLKNLNWLQKFKKISKLNFFLNLNRIFKIFKPYFFSSIFTP
jgi:hypothetical protein